MACRQCEHETVTDDGWLCGICVERYEAQQRGEVVCMTCAGPEGKCGCFE